MNILFRADSSSTIGTGHIMRDLVLAKQFKNVNITFACQDLKGNLIDKIPYKVEILKSNDIDELNVLIKKLNIDMIVIDHYGIDYNYERQLKIQNPKLKILSFDDTYEKHYCDILLNHNISADEKRYEDLVPSYCELRCGEKYTLIRDDFIHEKKKTREKIYDIFIAMGGADTANLNIKLLEILPKDYKIAVVTTTANKNLEDLKEYVKKEDYIELFIDFENIAKLINKSKFVIITPSVMAHEVLYLDIPFLAIKTSENQKFMFRYLLEHGYKVLDNFQKDKINQICIELKDFTKLTYDEKVNILSWRNYPDIKKWMFNKDTIKLKEHLDYIDTLKRNKDKKYFLVKYYGRDIGVIDFINIDNYKAEVGLYARPMLKGIGSTLMQKIIEYGFEKLNLKKLVAKVYKENVVAINLYKKFDFKQLYEKDSLIVMEKYR